MFSKCNQIWEEAFKARPEGDNAMEYQRSRHALKGHQRIAQGNALGRMKR